MDPKVWADAKRIFGEAIRRPREEREALVKEGCGDDLALRDLVERLLSGDDRFHVVDDRGGPAPVGEDLSILADLPGSQAESHSEATLQDQGPDWARDAGAPFKPDTLLSERYRVLRRLGRGGMGVVYAAQDIRLQRQVALKFLPPEWSRDDGAMQRFVREARAASALDHPNICTVHEIAELASHELFIVMTYYDGETLDRKIRRKDLSVDEAVDVTVRVARALDRAHEAGIFHRDIKPANIMITRHGDVKVLDFGLAKLLGQSRLSRRGQVMGTVAYMSPEQLRGERVDHRTDLWSLGVSLCEMLTGRTPFEGEPNEAVRRSILESEPRGMDELPRRLRPVVQQALQKKLRHRYQSAAHLLDDLEPLRASSGSGHRSTGGWRQMTRAPTRWKWLAGGVAAAVIAAVATLQFFGAPEPQRVQSVAILPFDNLSGDSADDYFVDGLTESLIAELGRVGALHVISRTTAMAYRDTTLTLTEIARELKVDAILEGAALRQRNRVRVTARLIRGDSESLLWSDSYDRDLGDVLTLMGEVARDLAGAVRVVLTPEETGRFAVNRRIDPKALDLYLRGRHLWYGGTVESSRAAIAMFEEAIAVAPSYALAYAGLADAYPALYYSGELSAEEAFGQSRLHALRSIELDDSLAEAYASLTRVSLELDWDWESAAVSIRRALEFNPNYAVAHHWLGWYFATVGRFEAAIEQIDRAHQLDPLSLRISGDRVRFTYLARRYDEAIEAANALLASDPRLRTPRRFLGRAYLEIGRFDEAVLELERAAGSGSPLIVLSDLAHAYAVSGKTEEASQMLDRLLERDPPPAFSVALVHLGLGRREQSLDWLERAYAERSTRLRSIKGDPRLDPLRLEPRFLDLLRRMKLDDAALAD